MFVLSALLSHGKGKQFKSQSKSQRRWGQGKQGTKESTDSGSSSSPRDKAPGDIFLETCLAFCEARQGLADAVPPGTPPSVSVGGRVVRA